jgi:sugar lactone lactonase YvrE
VVGQPDFVTSNPPVLGANRIGLPTGIAVDNSGNLYVADYRYHRVLEFDAVLAGDGIADRVFGHANFNNTDIRTTYALNGPSAIALDSMGNLYIADEIDNRVLEYDAPLLNDTYPDRVFGQPSFFSTGRNNGGIGATTLDTPLGLALDDNDTLYIADTDNHRILVYDTPLIADTIADRVFGQPDFTSSVVNNGGISASSLGFPYSVAIGQGGDVYVADTGNHRLLAFDKPIADPALAIARMRADEIAAGGPAFTLIVDGTGFASGATVRWNGSARPTTMQSSTQLAAQIGTADIAAQGAASVTVANPAGGISAPRTIDLYIPTPFDTVADRVIGQPNRRSGTPNYWGTSAPSLDQPFNIAIHPGSGRIFVPDTFNHRVLSWANAYALTNGQAADLVIGQPDFNTNDPNQGGMVSAATLNAPIGVDVDAKGNLYVADAFNHRVLEYDAPLSSGMAADRVFGQPDFTSNTANNSGVSASSLGVVFNVLVDPAGNLYVADGARVLEYDTPLSNDTIADHVFGQPDFTSNAPNNGGVSATSLSSVNGLASDSASNLYIADTSNHRVLEYAAPLSSDSVADRVFGQPDFTSNAMNNGGVGAGTLAYPYDVEVDRAGNLYIADTNNNRVLQFDAPLIGDTIADRVFGQPDFATTIASNSASATSLTRPTGIAVDGVGNVYISDILSNRIVE